MRFHAEVDYLPANTRLKMFFSSDKQQYMN